MPWEELLIAALGACVPIVVGFLKRRRMHKRSLLGDL